MVRDRNYWSSEISKIIASGLQGEEWIFTLKNGKEIHSIKLFYGNTFVHGKKKKGIKGYSFKIDELVAIKRAINTEHSLTID